MAHLNWLHLSDWHQKGKDSDRKVVLEALLEDIGQRAEKISPDLERIDFVVFSGDVAFSAKEEEYSATAESFFEPVLKKLVLKKLGLERDRFFIVPGNHDCDRDVFDMLPQGAAETFQSEKQIKEWLVNDKKRKRLLEPFESYCKFAENYAEGSLSGYADVLQFPIHGKTIALIGLNSALMTGRNKDSEGKVDDYGKLIIGEPQVREALERAEEADLRIAVAHHSFDWLSEHDYRVAELLKKGCHFILQGHNHASKAEVVRGTEGDCVIIPAGACYDRRLPSNPRYVNAYNFVHLDLETNQGTVYLRCWSDRQDEWREDVDTSPPDGKFEFGQTQPSPPPEPEPSPGAKYSLKNPPFFIPYPEKGEGMVGREEALRKVREQLVQGRKSYIGHTAAFQGLGGLGKTQLAVEYACRYKKKYPNGVIWINADQDIDSQLISLAKKAEWISPVSEHETILTVAKHRLKSFSDYLIIFDNVEKREDIEPYFPDSQENVHLLLTSRAIQKGFEPVPLQLLNEDSSLDLLLKESERKYEELSQEELEAAQVIVEALDGLPLAIEIAGAYLRYRPISMSFKQYLKILEDSLRKAMSEDMSGCLDQKHERSFYATLRVSQTVLKDAPLLREILDLLAWSGSGLMGISLMSVILDMDKVRLYHSLSLGVELRLLKKDPEKESYEIHRLLKQVEQEQVPLSDRKEWVEQVCLQLGDWFQDRREDFSDLPEFEAEINHLEQWLKLAEEYAPIQVSRLIWLQASPFSHRGQYGNSHSLVKTALERFKNDSNTDMKLKAHLLNDYGSTYQSLGKYQEAFEYYQQALNIRQQVLREEHPDTATSLNNIGGIYDDLGKYDQALQYHEKALKIYRQVSGDDQPDTAASLNNIGGVYASLGKYQQALEHYQQALKISRQVLGDDHPDTATSLNNIGGVYDSLGKYQQALEYYEQALEIYRQVLGDDHPHTASALNNIGGVYDSLGKYQKALEYSQQALKINRQVLGDDHPNTASSLNNIGRVYDSLEKYEQALEHYQQALKISRQVLGEEHPNTATSLNNIGGVYKHLGKYQQTTEYYQQALNIRQQVLGDEHPNTATSLNNIGRVYDSLGKYQEALEYSEQALKISRQVLGDDHPNTASSLNNIGRVYMNMGKYDQALEYSQQALKISRQVLGEEHLDTGASLNNIGGVYASLGKYEQALKHYQQALKISRQVLGEEHLDTGASLNNIGRVYMNMGKYDQALEHYQQALKISRQVLGEEHPNTATSLNNIGGVYDSLGKYDQALEHYQQALKIIRQVLGDDHPYTAASLNNTGLVYNSLGKYDQALEHYEQALKIRRQVLGDDHPDIANSLNNIGGVYYDSGKYKEALGYLKPALKIRRKVIGEDHPDNAALLYAIVLTMIKLRKFDQAYKLFKGFFSKLQVGSVSYKRLYGLDARIAEAEKVGFRSPSLKSKSSGKNVAKPKSKSGKKTKKKKKANKPKKKKRR